MGDRTLSRLIHKLPVIARHGSGDPAISSIAYDSRRVTPGCAFFALPGLHVDGHDFIDVALAAGAVVIFCERLPKKRDRHVVYLQVAGTRATMSRVSARFHDHPSRELPVIGVTGTDGKSTTTYLIDQLLTLAGEESGFISTALIKRDLQLEKNPFRQSTPEAPEIHGFLAEMRNNGKRFAVVEATSHGLSEKTSRLRDVQFQVAVFTNITHEHLEFHGTFEQYRSDKANLFRALDRTVRAVAGDQELGCFGVVNADDPNGYYFREATRRPVLSYAVGAAEADLTARDLEPEVAGTACVVRWRDESRRVFVPLAGPFNVSNVLAALVAVSRLLERNPLDLLELIPSLRPLPGRMQIVERGLPWVPIVDYAHTPGAFATVLPMVRGYTPGRLIVVFGSAGERDRAKRPMQGELAARHADVVILADEDPRGEDRAAILEEIAAGCERVRPDARRDGTLVLIPDRREAIARALSIAGPGDTLLFLGKGHEASIIYADSVLEWDEATVVREEIARLGTTGDAS